MLYDMQADMLKKAIKAAVFGLIHVNAEITMSDFPKNVGQPHPGTVGSR